MQAFEYKVIPAPNKGKKARGVKTAEDRFAHGVETILNEMATEGWEFLRADMLPSEERAGLTGSKTNWRNLLVFRRSLSPEVPATTAPAEPTAAAAVAPVVAAAATPETAPSGTAAAPQIEEPQPTARGAGAFVAPKPATATASPDTNEPPETTEAAPKAAPQVYATAGDPEAPPEAVAIPGAGARQMIADDGVEEISPVSGLTAALKKRAGLRDQKDENQ